MVLVVVVLGVHTPLMQVVHTPFIHLVDTELLPEPVDGVHTPFTHVVVTHVPLLHTVLCVTICLFEVEDEEEVCALAA